MDNEELREAVRDFLVGKDLLRQNLLPPTARAAELKSLWSQVAELGWLGLAVDENHGGMGLGFSELAVVYEELGRHLSPLPITGTLLAAEALKIAGSNEQKSHWLQSIACGETVVATALSLANSAYTNIDPQNVVSGILPHVLYADVANQLMLPARNAAGEAFLILVDTAAAGVTISPGPTVDLTRTLSAVHLREVKLESRLVMSLNPENADRLFDHASVSLACDSVGGAAHIFERTLEYLRNRVQFDRPVGTFQALKHRAANWKIALEAARALTQTAAEAIATQDPARSAMASSAKFYACDIYAALAGDAVQLHGGIGFTWEHECHLFLKRAKLNQTLYGSSSLHKDRVASLSFIERESL
jgi:alkylation response protein AidB-like acyl-CoA dehydrogenase